MDTPQEVEVWFVLPALRREIALGLKKEGMKQKSIAKTMGLSEPAVSQYLKNKRGNEVKFPKEFKREIQISVRKIREDNTRLLGETQKLLKMLKKNRFLCVVCHDHTNTNENCNVCYVG